MLAGEPQVIDHTADPPEDVLFHGPPGPGRRLARLAALRPKGPHSRRRRWLLAVVLPLAVAVWYALPSPVPSTPVFPLLVFEQKANVACADWMTARAQLLDHHPFTVSLLFRLRLPVDDRFVGRLRELGVPAADRPAWLSARTSIVRLLALDRPAVAVWSRGTAAQIAALGRRMYRLARVAAGRLTRFARVPNCRTAFS
jgi:hypothetical protein